MYDFLEFANMTNSTTDSLFRMNPEWFYPQQCYNFKPRESSIFNSSETPERSITSRNNTAIGIVRNRNRVEVNFID